MSNLLKLSIVSSGTVVGWVLCLSTLLKGHGKDCELYPCDSVIYCCFTLYFSLCFAFFEAVMKVNELHMEFLSISEFLVELSDDLSMYRVLSLMDHNVML